MNVDVFPIGKGEFPASYVRLPEFITHLLTITGVITLLLGVISPHVKLVKGPALYNFPYFTY